MRKRQFYYYSNLTPFAALGFAFLALAAFFITLPILIAALVVFGGFAAFMAWRITKAIKKAEKELLKQKDTCIWQDQSEIIIDITPELEEKSHQ